MNKVALSGTVRDNIGTKHAAQLRREKRVPCVLYGGDNTIHFSVEEASLRKVVFTPEVNSVELDLGGTKTLAMVHQKQFHPLTDRVIHVDFMEMKEDREARVKLSIRLSGQPAGVRQGGKLNQTMRKLMVKGLPSGYNRDFHEDKEITVEIFDIAIRMTETFPSLIESTTLNLKRMAELAGKNFTTATELANYLVLVHNVPFREAHHVVGSLVGELSRMGQNFDNFDYCYEHLKKNNINAPKEDVKRVIDAKSVMMAYNALGSTGPIATKATIKNLRADLERHRKIYDADQKRVDTAFNATRNLASQIGGAKSYEDFCRIVQSNVPKY